MAALSAGCDVAITAVGQDEALGKVFATIAAAGVSHTEAKALRRKAVESHVSGFHGPCAPVPGSPLMNMQEVLAAAEAVTGTSLDVSRLKKALRSGGDAAVARRVGRLSAARNATAHPDVMLAKDVAHALKIEEAAVAGEVDMMEMADGDSIAEPEQERGDDLQAGYQALDLGAQIGSLTARLETLEQRLVAWEGELAVRARGQLQGVDSQDADSPILCECDQISQDLQQLVTKREQIVDETQPDEVEGLSTGAPAATEAPAAAEELADSQPDQEQAAPNCEPGASASSAKARRSRNKKEKQKERKKERTQRPQVSKLSPPPPPSLDEHAKFFISEDEVNNSADSRPDVEVALPDARSKPPDGDGKFKTGSLRLADWRALQPADWGLVHARFAPRHRVAALLRLGAMDDALELLMDEFADRLDVAGSRRCAPLLSWGDLGVIGFRRSLLYDRCCERFHYGAMDPRKKTDEFFSLYREMCSWLAG